MSDDRWIEVPNWDRFQHYGLARRPLWIKNYITLLHKDEYLDLPLAARGLLHGIWLAYADRDGRLRCSDLGPELHARARDAHLAALNHAGLLQFSASKPLYLSTTNTASLETEASTSPAQDRQLQAAERWIENGAATELLELSDKRFGDVLAEEFKITDPDVVAALIARARQSQMF